jgi:hypothetical protein
MPVKWGSLRKNKDADWSKEIEAANNAIQEMTKALEGKAAEKDAAEKAKALANFKRRF